MTVNIAVNLLLPRIDSSITGVANNCATANSTTSALGTLTMSSGRDSSNCSHSSFNFHAASISNGNYSMHSSILTHSLASVTCGCTNSYIIRSNALTSPCATRAVRFMHNHTADTGIRVSRIITLRGT